jgi:hypothetical protein
MRIAHIGSLILSFAILSLSQSLAVEGPRQRIREVFAEAEFSSGADTALQDLLKSSKYSRCDFFGYDLQCTASRITARQLNGVFNSAASIASQSYNYLKRISKTPPRDRLTIINAVSQDPDWVNVLVVGLLPGYIPYASYDGTLSDVYRDLEIDSKSIYPETKPEAYDKNPEYYDKLTLDWHKGIGVLNAGTDRSLKQIRVASQNFERILRTPFIEFDSFGHDLFGDFAAISQVFDGQGVASFWNDFLKYSKDADLSNCESGCTVAFEFNSTIDRIKSIAICSIVSVNRIAGGPEDCYTVLTNRDQKTYVRAALFLNAIQGLDGIGGDELACKIEAGAKGVDSVDLSKQIVSKFLSKNDPGKFISYVADTKKKGDLTTVLVANRFGQSMFFPGLNEISTIRLDIYNSDGSITVDLSTSAFVFNRNSQNQSDYNAVTDAQSATMRQEISDILKPLLDCRVSRGI